MEEALRRSEERYRLLVEQTVDGIFVADATGRYVDVNRSGCEMLGYSREEVLSLSFQDVLVPEDWERIGQEVARLAGGQVVRSEWRFRRKDGSILVGEVVGRQLPDGRLQGILRDITERKRAEEALRDRDERLQKLANNLPNSAVYQYVRKGDSPGRFTYFSAGIEKLTGVSVEEALRDARKLHALILPEHLERLMAEEARCLRELADFQVEVPMRRTDGEVRWMSIRSRPRVLAEGTTVWDGVQTDITERKEFQAELERLVAERTEKLQELVGELEHFSYTITHDMKAPLRAMRGFAEIACQVCGQTEAKPFLDKISTAAERMDALIRDALNYSRAVRQELPLEDVDLGGLLRGILDSYPEFQPSKARIRVEGRLPVVLGNEAGLTQSFSNLLGNAVKFVKPGQMPQIRIWAEEREGWSRIWVEDQGIGIAPEMQARVFDMFSRAVKGYEGTGQGRRIKKPGKSLGKIFLVLLNKLYRWSGCTSIQKIAPHTKPD